MPHNLEAAGNYTLGRGKLYFVREGEANQAGTRYLGNSPEVNVNVEVEDLDHFNSDMGIRTKDDTITLEVTRSGTFTLDDINMENMALFFLGTTDLVTTVEAANQTDTWDDVEEGLYYQLGTSAGSPQGAMLVSSVVVSDDAVPTTTYTEGIDYTVDLETGVVYVVPGGNIGTDMHVDYTLEGQTQIRTVEADTSIVGKLVFRQHNPKGRNHRYTFPRCKISPNGDLALKGDEWQQQTFSLEALDPTDGSDQVIIETLGTAT